MSADALDGRRKIAEGREAIIYEWDDGLVARVMRSADAGAVVHRSAAASEAARLAGVATPRIESVTDIDGLPAQIMERVDGVDLFERLAANPLRLFAVARILIDVHVELHEAAAPAELVTSHEHFGAQIERSPLIPDDVRQRALTCLAELPHADIVCHGDYHPGNVLVGDSLPPTLIDWTGATRGEPAADFARTRLMLRLGELPPGAPLVIRALARVGRAMLRRSYDRGYRQARPVDTALLAKWTLVAASVRLGEGIESERSALLRLIEGLDV